jgi:peroxiredoxin
MARIAGTILGLLLALPAPANSDKDKDKPGTPREQFISLRNELVEAGRGLSKAFQDAKTEEEKNKILQELDRLEDKFATSLFTLAKEHANDPIAVHGLVFLANTGFIHGDCPGADKRRAKAIAILKRDLVMNENIGFACAVLAYTMGPEDLAFLRSVLEKNPHRDAQGLACLTLAEQLKKSADNNEKLAKEAEELFARAEANYADVKLPAGGTVGSRAKAELFELRCVGKEAPDIVGEDHDSKVFKLSDYKGKVVLIDFWWSSCGSCRAMWPYHRSLLKKLEGKPFTILGVNRDPLSKEALKKVVEDKEITWRSWWDGGSMTGPIASKWNAHVGPTLYVLDHKGVIRHKWVGTPAEGTLDKAIEKLVAEAVKEDIKVSK